jgi:hypothetical protein
LLKKLLKGDGSWNTQKLILGWIMDTICQTIELPPHGVRVLDKLFSTYPMQLACQPVDQELII